MTPAVKVTVKDLIRALRRRAHELADDVEHEPRRPSTEIGEVDVPTAGRLKDAGRD